MADEHLKVIKHDGWTETIFPNGGVLREGNTPDYMEREFYGRYNPGTAKIRRYRLLLNQEIALAQKLLEPEE